MFSKGFGPDATMLAVVQSVDEDACTCVLKDDDNEELVYEDVRLRPVIDGNESVTIFPKEGTWALAIRIEEDEDWMVIAVGEADKVRIVSAGCDFEVSDGFLIKKGSETLKKILNDLMTAIKAIVVPTNVGPSGNPLNAAVFTDINTRIDNLLK